MDLSTTIAPKSDQLNADDLIAGPKTIRVTDVKAGSAPEQPVSIHFAGDGGKPYKPCKSMRRVLVRVWGADGKKYVGRSMTIYRDDAVVFGGMAVGGIRISHVSDIGEPVQMALTASKAKRASYTVRPLALPFRRELAALKATATQGMKALESAWKALPADARAELKDELPSLKEQAGIAEKQQPETPTQAGEENEQTDATEHATSDDGDPFGG